MKKYLSKISLALLSLAVFTGCDEDIVNYDQGNLKTQAEFSKEESSVLVYKDGTADDFYAQVGVSTISNVDRVIYYDIDETATTATSDQYTIDASGVAVIPAGSYFGKIKVAGVLSALADDEKVLLVLNLTGIGQVGDPNVILNTGKTTTELTIYKTCRYDGSVIGNTLYTGETAAEEDYNHGSAIYTHEPDVVLTKITDREFRLKSLWGANFFDQLYGLSADGFELPGTIIVNDDLTLEFKGVVASQGLEVISTTGYYDPCDNFFIFDIEARLPWMSNPDYDPNDPSSGEQYIYSNIKAHVKISEKEL